MISLPACIGQIWARPAELCTGHRRGQQLSLQVSMVLKQEEQRGGQWGCTLVKSVAFEGWRDGSVDKCEDVRSDTRHQHLCKCVTLLIGWMGGSLRLAGFAV